METIVDAKSFQMGFDAASAELKELKADAARYEWILVKYTGVSGGKGMQCSFFVPVDHEDLGCAIDQAIIDGLSARRALVAIGRQLGKPNLSRLFWELKGK